MRHLVLIDTSGNIVLCDVQNEVRMPIGKPLDPSQRARVTTAVWSPDGEWTAWSTDSVLPDGPREVRFHNEATDEASVLAESVAAFYLAPSPGGRWLSHLSPGPLGLELALSEVLTGDLQVIERGQPLFWSWSSDASSLALHVEDRVLVAHLDGTDPRLLSDDGGSFVVPWWMPGGSVLFATGDQLVVVGSDDAVSTVVDHGATGRFSPDPDRRRIAYVERSSAGPRLLVIDLLTGSKEVVTTQSVAAFFWSPDGNRLAVLASAGDGRTRWIVFENGETRDLPPFRPNPRWAAAVLPFFEQYAQSHSCWSSDNRLVVPAVDDEGNRGALIQESDLPYSPQWVPNADLAWWA